MRLFVGIDLPDDVDEQLQWIHGGIHGARWEPPERLHLTLRYIGEVDGGKRDEIVDALGDIEADGFELQLHGVGHFPPRGQPRSVWAGVADDAPLVELHRRIDRTLVQLGLEPDRRKFAAHVTLARLRHSPAHEVAEFLARHSLLRLGPWWVDRFTLYASIRSPGGSKYLAERHYPLAADGRPDAGGV